MSTPARPLPSTAPSAANPVIRKRVHTRKVLGRDRRSTRAPGALAASGQVSTREKSVIDGIVAENDGQVSRDQLDATAIVLRRDPSTIARYIEIAKEKLQSRAERYVDIHLEATEKALASDDPRAIGEARKGAMEMISSLSAKDRQGKSVRLIDRDDHESSGPKIAIGINLGGLPARTAGE